MALTHKNKTFATFLATLLGSVGMHRFYMKGMTDRWGWVHLSSLLLTGIAMRIWPEQPLMLTASPLILSALAGFLEALVIGLTPDEKWDPALNAGSGKQSSSGGLLAVVLVLTTGIGAVSLIAVIARTLDLLFTGGAYG